MASRVYSALVSGLLKLLQTMINDKSCTYNSQIIYYVYTVMDRKMTQ